MVRCGTRSIGARDIGAILIRGESFPHLLFHSSSSFPQAEQLEQIEAFRPPLALDIHIQFLEARDRDPPSTENRKRAPETTPCPSNLGLTSPKNAAPVLPDHASSTHVTIRAAITAYL
jgi:hypothetical protein